MENFEQVIILINRGEKNNAMAALARILQANPRSTDAWMLMADLQEEPARKADCYRQVLKINPGHVKARLHMEALSKHVSPGQEKAPGPAFPAQESTLAQEVKRLSTAVRATAPAAPTGMLETSADKDTSPLQIPLPNAPAPLPATPAGDRQAFNPIAKKQTMSAQEYVQRVNGLEMSGKNSEALKLLDEGLHKYPRDKVLWGTFVGISPSVEHSTAVIDEWLKIDPDNPAVLEAQKIVNKEKSFTREEGCLNHALYLIVGILSLSLLFLIMQLPSLLLTGKIAESGKTPANMAEGFGYIWAMFFSLVIFFLMIFTMVYGCRGTWLGKMKNGLIKYAIIFFCLFIPVGWYFMGRGIYIFFFVDMDDKKETT